MRSHREMGLFLLIATTVGCSTVRVERRPGDDPSDPWTPNGTPACPALQIELDSPGTNDTLDVFAAASGPSCSSVMVGSYAGSADIGGPLPNQATWTGWVASVDGVGSVSWRHALQDAGDDVSSAHGVLVDESGNIWISGTSEGALLLDGVEVLPGSQDFVLALSADGEPRWGARLPGYPSHGALRDDGVSYFVEHGGSLEEIWFDGTSGASTTRQIAVGEVGLMAGATRGELTAFVGCTSSQFTVADQVAEHHDDTPDGNGYPTCDIVLFAVDRQGGLRFLHTFEEEGFFPYIAAVAIDDDGDVALSTSFWGAIDLGDGLLSASTIGSGMRLLLATFTASGALQEAGAFGEAAFTFGSDVVLKSDGGFAVAGTIYDGSVDFGQAPIESGALSYMGFQVDLSSDGELSSSKAELGLEAMFESRVGAPFLVSRRLSDDGADLGVRVERAAE